MKIKSKKRRLLLANHKKTVSDNLKWLIANKKPRECNQKMYSDQFVCATLMFSPRAPEPWEVGWLGLGHPLPFERIKSMEKLIGD
jgi:hypothetical protein